MSKRKNEPTAALAAPMKRMTSDQMRDRLAALREKLEDSWPGDAKYDKLAAEVADLERQIRVAEVNEVQPSAPMSLTFEERPIAIATIVITGNHREEDDEPATIALANSLKTHNLQQRIGVRATGDGRFELIFGSRRLAAAKLAGWEEIPAKVYESDLTPAQVEILRSIENFGRKNLTPVEEAVAIARTIDAITATIERPAKMVMPDTRGVPNARAEQLLAAYEDRRAEADAAAKKLQAEINTAGGLYAYVGQQFSRKPEWVRDHAYVSKLGGNARKLLMARRIDLSHARELAKLGDPQVADGIADEAARDERGLGGKDAAYVRGRVRDHLKSLRVVPWQLDVAFGQGKAGCTGHACVTCPHNSKTDPDLFGGSITDEPEAGVCTNETCFRAKTEIVEKDMAQVAKRARPLVKKADGVITQVTVGGLLPRHVKPTSGIRKLQKVLADLVPAKGGSDAAPGDTPSARSSAAKKTPEQIAHEKLAGARSDWLSHVRDAVRQAAANDTGAGMLVSFLLLRETGSDYLSNGFLRVGDSISESDRKLMDLAFGGRVNDLLKAVRKNDMWWEYALDFLDNDEAAARAVEKLKLDLPKPTLEQFLPKPKVGKTLAAAEPSFEDAPIHFAADLKTTLAKIEAADQLAAMQTFKGARPKIKPIEIDGFDWIVLGTKLIRGVECWQLASLGLSGDLSEELTGEQASQAALDGKWHGIGVLDGKYKRRIYADPAANPPTLIFVNAVVEDGGSQA